MNGFKEIIFLQNLKGIGKATIQKNYLNFIAEGVTIPELRKLLSAKFSEDILNEAERMAETSEYELLQKPEIKVITVLDSEYPRKLRIQGNSMPLILYTQGKYDLLYEDNIAIIGTREPSEWSIKVEERLVKKIIELSERVIVSGLALGCDTVAHKACLDAGGRTIAVLPSGLDIITPAGNKELSAEIIRNDGLLISEYGMRLEATKYTFVQRDAIIAAISDATFAIECGVDSGTMETVKNAEKYGKRIATYITTYNSRGNYTGNIHMVNKYGADGITDTASLTTFLQNLRKSDGYTLLDLGRTDV